MQVRQLVRRIGGPIAATTLSTPCGGSFVIKERFMMTMTSKDNDGRRAENEQESGESVHWYEGKWVRGGEDR